jgi:hypothetical protein
VTNTLAHARTHANPAAPEAAENGARGWYFYGITLCGLHAAILADAQGAAQLAGDSAADAAVGLIECGDLVAVVRPVLLGDFSVAVLQERLRSVSELERMVRSHNRVIEAIHEHRAILPAKFGSVYANSDNVVTALQSGYDSLLRQLHNLEGCDEWAVHLYADRAVVRERISMQDLTIRRLQEERAAARPGRAYFLERQIRDELEVATQQALVTLAQDAFDRLVGYAVAGQLDVPGPGVDSADDVEILRAAFLVERDSAEQFEQEMRDGDDGGEGLRWDHSGPWPPYSFAIVDEVERT